MKKILHKPLMNKRTISVFEHETLKLGNSRHDISTEELSALQRFYGSRGVPFFSLIYQGVKFNSYVGVIQEGSLTIEILPKADKYAKDDGQVRIWQRRLI